MTDMVLSIVNLKELYIHYVICLSFESGIITTFMKKEYLRNIFCFGEINLKRIENILIVFD